MSELKEIFIVESLQKKWKLLSLCSLGLISAAFTVLCIAFLHQLFQLSFVWTIPVWAASFFLIILSSKSWQIKISDVTIYLNRNIPQLEESSGLLLKSLSSLSLLEQMQVNKLKEKLEYVSSAHPINTKLKNSTFVFVIAFIISVSLFLFVRPLRGQSDRQGSPTTASTPGEKVFPTIASITVKIVPPNYTGRQTRTQRDLNLQAEEGARITWELKTNRPVQDIRLQFNDTTMLQFTVANKGHTTWTASKTIKHSGFYHVKVNEQLSDLYKWEMIKDQPPVINVQSPQSSSVIDFGEPQKTTVTVNLSDDYGISSASILATVASGSGEAVKFSEREIQFFNSIDGEQKSYQLKKSIDLPSLGMKPGDELYLYVKATDNHRQETRSDMYIVSIADTAELMSLDAVINGINLKPEYFRSQRQIIIETEQLLKDKSVITVQAFNDKSNDLGIDQKLLRLRYGKFLGEEFEANIGEHEEGDHHDANEKNETSDIGNAQEIMNEFSHQHDIAEDATFFDAETKKQLKAVLAEMWKAELQLRTLKPAAALPFEYKALRLLKDLQQQSRVYVAKTNIKTPPLKPETRLSGELDKVISPATKESSQQNTTTNLQLQQALSILEVLKYNMSPDEKVVEVLQQARQHLTQQAAIEPGKYLSSLQSFQRILTDLQQQQKINNNDVIIVQQVMQQMLATPEKKPAQPTTIEEDNLSKQYFLNLEKNTQR